MFTLPPPLEPHDENRHPVGDESPIWSESYYLDFTTSDGSFGGYVRIGVLENLGAVWYWACVVGEGRPLVTVIDHTVPLPAPGSLAVQSDGLRADYVVTSPFERASVSLDATHAAVLDDPADTYGDGELPGGRVPLRLDLEWKTVGGVYPYPGMDRYEIPCRVHGQIVVGDETIDFEGHGERDHSWAVRDWWHPEWTWTAGRIGDDTWFHAMQPKGDASFYQPGFTATPEGLQPLLDGNELGETVGEHGFPTTGRMRFAGLDLTVTPLHFSPVRLVAPDGAIDHFPRALCRFEAADGRVGHGWTEWNQPVPPSSS